MNVRLAVEQGARRRVVNIDQPEAVIGRAHGNTVRIPSAQVSRQHCRILVVDGLVMVEDLGSVNGTFLNGRRLNETEYVRPGDHLEVGPVTFVVEYEMTPDALARLRGEEAAGVLELLADGDALGGAEDLPMLQPADELPLLEMAEDPGLALAPPREDEIAEVLAAEDDGPLPMDFDMGPGWQMPQGGDLRDILAQMEDENTPPQAPKPRKPR
jgi:predicted component of type VI protein secretion system